MIQGKTTIKITIAATAFACMTLLSFGWSEQRGVSLSIASAQAQTGHRDASRHVASRHVASRHVAAIPHRHWRHAYGYNPNPVAACANLAAGAVNTAGALAAGAIGTAGAIAGAPFGVGPYAGPSGYYASSTWGDFECSSATIYPGCRPYASKDWSHP